MKKNYFSFQVPCTKLSTSPVGDILQETMQKMNGFQLPFIKPLNPYLLLIGRFPVKLDLLTDNQTRIYTCSLPLIRPTDDKITLRSNKRGALMFKRVGHSVLSKGSNQGSGSLIELVCNSCYAGLPEVYLLHEGCEVIGEDIQVISKSAESLLLNLFK